MSEERLTAPALLAHVFLAASDQDASAGWDRLLELWGDVTGRFGLRLAVPVLGVAVHVPEPAAAADRPCLLAAAESDADAVWQALAWADHGLLCVTVMMAPPRGLDCATAWTSLESAWAGVTAGRPAAWAIGEARILLALIAGQEQAAGAAGQPDDEDATVARTLELVKAAVQAGAVPSAPGWWRHWDTVPLGSGAAQVPVWELGPDVADARPTRRLAVVAPERLEHLVDHLSWTRGDGRPTPLTRHLMHAARLRHQVRVFDEAKAARSLRDELSGLVDEAVTGPAAWREPAGPDGLGARLARARAAAVALKARMDAMRLAADVIGQNMARAVSLGPLEVAVGPLSADQHLATWLRTRLEDEIALLDSAAASARSVADLLAGPPAGPPAAPRRPPVADPLSTPVNGHASVNGPRTVLASRPAEPRAPCVVVLTALAVEYEAIRDHLGGQVGSLAESGTLYETGELPGVSGSWRLAIAQTGPGSAAVGVQLERAVRVFRPEIALFLGVAGGRRDVARGDVVAADKIYDYETGRSSPEGYRPRMSAYKPAFRLVQRAQRVARENKWQRRIRPAGTEPPPRAFVKPIATGAKVVANDRSAVARLLDRYASDALAVETEGHGFLEGAYLNPGVDALVIRGISDLLVDKDPAGDRHWQPIASRHAAAFAVELLDSLGAGAD